MEDTAFHEIVLLIHLAHFCINSQQIAKILGLDLEMLKVEADVLSLSYVLFLYGQTSHMLFPFSV